jgi:predicted ATP-binding protein involved in virulence
MKVARVKLKNIRSFQGEVEVDLSDSMTLNVISGKNGSGKTTIFKSMHLCQKAFFLLKMDDNQELIESLGIELFRLFNHADSYIELYLETKNDEEVKTHSLKLSCRNYLVDSIDWDLSVSDEDEHEISKYWNLSNPSSVIMYIPSDKHFVEENISQDKISISSDDDYQKLIVDSIISPDKLFSNLYKRMVNDYIRERLIPSKPRRDLYRNVAIGRSCNLSP